MTRRTNCHFFIDEDTQEIVHVDIIYRMPIKKYQKASKYGSHVFCPYCNHMHIVFDLSWWTKRCYQCDRLGKKADWTIRCGANKLSKRVAFVNPKIKSYIPHDKLHYGKDSIWQHH